MATPLTAAAVLTALRAEGVTVVEVGNWRTHNREGHGNWGPVHGVVVHHTVTSGTASSVAICRDGYAGLPGPLCHGVIDKTGTVHLVGWGRTNHAGKGDGDVLQAVIDERALPAPNDMDTDGNAHFYGFECINLGDGQDPWPAAQLEAMVRAVAALCRAHGWSAASVIGHKEWTNTKNDPRGFTMADFRAAVAERLARPAGSGTPAPDPAPTTPSQEADVPAPMMLNEANPKDVDLPSGEWVGLAFADPVVHSGPRLHDTLVHVTLAPDTPADTLVEGRFYLTDTAGGSPSAYQTVTRRGGGGHQFALSGVLPAGRHLRFQLRATTADGAPVALLHRTVSGPYWPAS
ncbi:N-acetylmuramoyl-L-alanine amidase [Streptomyces sp. MBT49]|uniref:peptidoglycan recognition protein family protein n=1 Tax=Streptomyces sp. MBT49 TaxID=1488380 RepID=UPI00190B0295|nr:N-acetylmuramoyl-L-alanine amidase [Streptomyces sp. MBT49]MBK3625910.1 N-acetylmuramoyl-L-alanine amidase [Streptomyces sp. MBT49]